MNAGIKIKVLVEPGAVKLRMEDTSGDKIAEVNLAPSAAERLGEELFRAGRDALGRERMRRKP